MRHPERVEQRHIVGLLRSLGCVVYVSGTTRPKGDRPSTMQTPGIPDLEAFLPRGLGILKVEVKSAHGKLSPEQDEYRRLCMACEAPNQVHYVTGTCDTVIEWLMMIGLLKAENVAHYRQPVAVRHRASPHVTRLTPEQEDAQDEWDAFRARGMR